VARPRESMQFHEMGIGIWDVQWKENIRTHFEAGHGRSLRRRFEVVMQLGRQTAERCLVMAGLEMCMVRRLIRV
jgi:hypothetical protein